MPSSSSLLLFASSSAALIATVTLIVRIAGQKNRKLDKNRIYKLRQQFFSNSNSVSYANTGPLLILKGRGSFLYDEKNTKYLDTRNNVAHCGHSHPVIVRAVQRQVQQLNTNTRYLHPTICELAEKLVQKCPGDLSVVFFCNSGSEANDLALRLARAYTGSRNTIVVQHAYHGHTLATLDVSPYKYETSGEFALIKANDWAKTPGRHIWQVPSPDVYRGPHRDGETAAERYSEYIQKACDHYKQRGESVGAFIVEGGMSVAGVILPPKGYIQKCAHAVRDAGGVYIADEVQTGFGRLGKHFWAFEYQNVIPDIVTVGKPFGNGMPLAAVVTTRAVAAQFERCNVEYFNTFGGNPVSAAAGLAMMQVLEDEKLQQNAWKVGSYLKERFQNLQEKIDWIGDVRGCGLFLGVELVKDRETLEPASTVTSWLCSHLKVRYKILTSIDGPNDNVLVIKPPMVFSQSNADVFVDAFEQALMKDLPLAGDLFDNVSKTPT